MYFSSGQFGVEAFAHDRQKQNYNSREDTTSLRVIIAVFTKYMQALALLSCRFLQ